MLRDAWHVTFGKCDVNLLPRFPVSFRGTGFNETDTVNGFDLRQFGTKLRDGMCSGSVTQRLAYDALLASELSVYQLSPEFWCSCAQCDAPTYLRAPEFDSIG